MVQKVLKKNIFVYKTLAHGREVTEGKRKGNNHGRMGQQTYETRKGMNEEKRGNTVNYKKKVSWGFEGN